MKLTWRDIDSFLKKPPAHIKAILVYGPDTGLIAERVQMLAKTQVADVNDPFSVSALDADNVASDKALLVDEASAISMFGGKRLVKVAGVTDKTAVSIKHYLQNAPAESFVLCDGGDLGARSALRLLFEKSENAAALPCYADDAKGASMVIRNMLRDQQFTIENDALSYLAEQTAGNRLRLRSEIDKLMVYMGDDKRITLAHALANTGNIEDESIDDLVYALGDRNFAEAEASYKRLLQEGVAPIQVTRACTSHFRRLHQVLSFIAQGASIDDAMKSLTPIVFFKLEPRFRAQLNRWNMPALARAIDAVQKLESACKKTGSPVESLISHSFYDISRAA
ncbi:MAG: DNA polymerase III subunit delta [Alphaproteobacteria bacterium]|nr:DNA polymerase III subunit delta [Alphaproteobacteria bacterium]